MSNSDNIIILDDVVIVNAGEEDNVVVLNDVEDIIMVDDEDSITDEDVIDISSDDDVDKEDNGIIIDDTINITNDESDEEDDSDDDDVIIISSKEEEEDEALRGESPLSFVTDIDMGVTYDSDSLLSLSVSQIEDDRRPPSRGSSILSEDSLIHEQTSDYCSLA